MGQKEPLGVYDTMGGFETRTITSPQGAAPVDAVDDILNQSSANCLDKDDEPPEDELTMSMQRRQVQHCCGMIY